VSACPPQPGRMFRRRPGVVLTWMTQGLQQFVGFGIGMRASRHRTSRRWAHGSDDRGLLTEPIPNEPSHCPHEQPVRWRREDSKRPRRDRLAVPHFAVFTVNSRRAENSWYVHRSTRQKRDPTCATRPAGILPPATRPRPERRRPVRPDQLSGSSSDRFPGERSAFRRVIAGGLLWRITTRAGRLAIRKGSAVGRQRSAHIKIP